MLQNDYEGFKPSFLFIKYINNKKFENKAGYAYVAKDIDVVVGEIHGEIADKVDEGSQGFEYDPIFIAKEYGKPFSSCTTLEKIKVSHRGKSLAKMIKIPYNICNI